MFSKGITPFYFFSQGHPQQKVLEGYEFSGIDILENIGDSFLLCEILEHYFIYIHMLSPNRN